MLVVVLATLACEINRSKATDYISFVITLLLVLKHGTHVSGEFALFEDLQ